MQVKRTSLILRPDCSRVFFRPFELHSREQLLRVLARVMSLTEQQAEREADVDVIVPAQIRLAHPAGDPRRDERHAGGELQRPGETPPDLPAGDRGGRERARHHEVFPVVLLHRAAYPP